MAVHKSWDSGLIDAKHRSRLTLGQLPPSTVINFFNTQPGGVKNLGGYVDGKPAIMLNYKSANQFTFTVPKGAEPGASFIQAINPPFTPYTSSGNDPGGAFTLR
jgi:hypothetical protein